LYENNSIYVWPEVESHTETLNMSIPVLDFVRSPAPPEAGRTCIIDMHGVLTCPSEEIAFSQSIAEYQIPLNRHNQLTVDTAGSVCTLIGGQMSCSGDTQRLRIGGHAMQPRHTIRRVIHIARTGID
jgi:hypothetical protein